MNTNININELDYNNNLSPISVPSRILLIGGETPANNNLINNNHAQLSNSSLIRIK